MSTKLERQQRQREYHLLRNQVQELREKVEPIKHTRRMDRLSAEKEKLQNFLERSGEKRIPIKKPDPAYMCGNPACEEECMRADYQTSANNLPLKTEIPCDIERTHPFHSNCGSGLCHAEGCICAMCFKECLSCRCVHCRNSIYENCIFLAKNLPIKTEPPPANAQVMAGVGDFLDQIDNFPGALEKALQDARARKALDDYKSSLQRIAATAPIHEEDLYGLHRLEDSDDGVIPHLYNCGCENCRLDDFVKNCEFLTHINHCQCGEFANVCMDNVWYCGGCALAKIEPPKEISPVVEPIKPTIRECGCGNEALSQHETCLACRVGVGKRNQETPLEIAPAVSEPINNSNHPHDCECVVCFEDSFGYRPPSGKLYGGP